MNYKSSQNKIDAILTIILLVLLLALLVEAAERSDDWLITGLVVAIGISTFLNRKKA